MQKLDTDTVVDPVPPQEAEIRRSPVEKEDGDQQSPDEREERQSEEEVHSITRSRRR